MGGSKRKDTNTTLDNGDNDEAFQGWFSARINTTSDQLKPEDSRREEVSLKIFEKHSDRSLASVDRMLNQIENEQRHRHAMQWTCLGVCTFLVLFSVFVLCYITVAGVPEKYIYTGFGTLVVEVISLLGIILKFMFSKQSTELYDKIIALKNTNDAAYDKFDKD